MARKEELIERLTISLRLKGRDWTTIRSYTATAGHYIDFCFTCPPDFSSEQKAEAYLTKRAMQDYVAASTQNHDLAALNAFYESQGRKLGNVDALRAKRPVYARHCPSRGEVVALLKHLADTPSIPARLVAMILYGAGTRINETLEIRLKDVRLGESHFVMRDTKSNNDRVVKIPEIPHPAIRRQIEHAKRAFEMDEQRPNRLPLQTPSAIARKYPRAPHSLGWAFLFPWPRPQRHPNTKAMVRWHLPDWTIQEAFSKACDDAQLLARITPHCLRHGFGTHFEGDIRDLQAQLGHKSLETTQGYRHPHIDRIRSPLDDMAGMGALIEFPSASTPARRLAAI